MAMIRPLVLMLIPVTIAGAQQSPAPPGAPGPTPDATSERNDSVSVRLIDVDLRAAVSALSPYLDRPVVFGAVPSIHVTLETPHPVPRGDVARLLGGLITAQNLEMTVDTAANVYRVRAHEAPPPALTTGPGGPKGDAPQLFVIHLSHARAADVAATVNSLYGRSSALGEPGALRDSKSANTQNQLPPTPLIGGPTPSTAPQAVSSVAGKSAAFTGETTIVPDAGTNSLLVRANANDFALIEAAVKQLDVRPLQVLIEVVIAELSTTANWSFGVSTTVAQQAIKGTGTSLGGSIAGLGSGDFALTVMQGNLQLTAQLDLAASKGEARILERPVVLAQNNQEAEILVGSQQPFIQVQQTQVGAVAQNQVVQYQDVGTKLTVKPTISGDGYIQLDLTQEVSEATTQVQFNAPVISTRSITTRLMARDSQTVVLGGFSDREKDKNSQGVPLLSELPLIGGLFGQKSRTTSDTEFFLFLTPRIVASDEDMNRVTQPIQRETQQFTP